MPKLCYRDRLSEVSDQSTQAIYAWLVAKTKFVTVLQNAQWLRKIVLVVEKSLSKHGHGVVSHNRAICPTSTQQLWSLQL